MQVKVYVFRHGETDWNIEERIQGSTDIPLNTKGEMQARNLALMLQRHKLEHIVTSPLLRALKTAEIVARELNLDYSVLQDLREASFGEAEGMTKSEIIARCGEGFWERWKSVRREDLDFNYLNGESKRSIRDRTIIALTQYLKKTSHRVVGVSTHGAVLRYFAHAFIAEGAPPIPAHNCALYSFYFDKVNESWSFEGSVKETS